MIITVNGRVDQTHTVTISSAPAFVTSISPSSVSPVLKEILTLAVTYPGTLDASVLSVKAVQRKNSSIYSYINVIEVGNESGNQYIKVKFGGQESGVYDIYVSSRTFGRFDSDGITLTLVGKVTDFHPKRGSIHGGTLVTITGYHFSEDPQDNPVRIGWEDCMVESTSETEIKCRTMATSREEDHKQDFRVYLKTYEEAACDVDPCTFQWVKEGLPKVLSYSTAFDPTLEDYVLTITGTDFGATTTNTEIFIDEVKQTILSASDTDIKVELTGLLGNLTRNVDLYLPLGIPDGMEDMLYTSGIQLSPIFTRFYPNSGSPQGTLITAQVRGVGVNTSPVTLVNSAGTDICASVTIPTYGVVQCLTKAMTVADTLSVKVGTSSFGCSGS